MRHALASMAATATLALALAHAAAAQTPTPTVIPPTFALGEPRAYPVGSEPVSVAVGNFNADTNLDLAVVNFSGESFVQLNNDGTGRFNRFGAEASLGTDTFPTWIATLRKDDDARHEILVTREAKESENPDDEFGGHAVTVRAGDFATLDNTLVGEFPSFARAGVDLNNDGREDAVVVNNFSDTLTLLLNRPSPVIYIVQTIDTVSPPISVAFGDFNGDQLPDLAAVSDSGDLAIHLNLGGAFSAAPRFASCPEPGCLYSTVALSPSALESGDLNRDGKMDLVIADSGAQSILVLLGHGDGSFQDPLSFELDGSPAGLALGDFNGDNRLDVAVSVPDLDGLILLAGLGNGMLSPDAYSVDLGIPAYSMVAADLNRDGKVDLAMTVDLLDVVAVVLNGVSPPAFTPTITRTPTRTGTVTRTRTPTQTPTSTQTTTPTRTATQTRTATITATRTATRKPCAGDCNGDGVITTDDLSRIIALFNGCPPCPGGGAPANGCAALPDGQCAAADDNHDGCLQASDLARARGRAGTPCD